MRIFIDTDILLDILLRREPHFAQSAAVLDWAENHPGRASVSWNGLANIHYLSRNGAIDFIRDLIGFCTVPEAGTRDMERALDLGFSDLEDAMQTAAALRFEAQIIVTRNLTDYRKAPLRVLSPSEVRSSLV